MSSSWSWTCSESSVTTSCDGSITGGAPGPRGEADENGNVFYAAYFRDRDGNKLNAFCMVPQG